MSFFRWLLRKRYIHTLVTVSWHNHVCILNRSCIVVIQLHLSLIMSNKLFWSWSWRSYDLSVGFWSVLLSPSTYNTKTFLESCYDLPPICIFWQIYFTSGSIFENWLQSGRTSCASASWCYLTFRYCLCGTVKILYNNSKSWKANSAVNTRRSLESILVCLVLRRNELKTHYVTPSPPIYAMLTFRIWNNQGSNGPHSMTPINYEINWTTAAGSS